MILAHLIGDFLLQFDWVHALKLKNLKGLLFHVCIVVGCLLIFVGPYIDHPRVGLFIAFVGITHFLQDWAKIRFTGQSKHQLLMFFCDQVVHIIFIASLFLTNLRTIGPTPNPHGLFFLDLYNNNTVILYFIAMVIASFAGHFIILLFKKDYLRAEITNNTFEKWYGFMERILIVFVLFTGMPWSAGIPMILVCRHLLHVVLKNKLPVSDQFSSITNILLSGGFSTTIGLVFLALI